jgi:hypothetical protein
MNITTDEAYATKSDNKNMWVLLLQAQTLLRNFTEG